MKPRWMTLCLVAVTIAAAGCAEDVTVGQSLFLSGEDRRVMEITAADDGWVELTNQGPGQLRLQIVERSVEARAEIQLGPRGMYRAQVRDTRRIVLVNDSGESTTVAWLSSVPGVEVHP